jgi:hypothetical protein
MLWLCQLPGSPGGRSHSGEPSHQQLATKAPRYQQMVPLICCQNTADADMLSHHNA